MEFAVVLTRYLYTYSQITNTTHHICTYHTHITPTYTHTHTIYHTPYTTHKQSHSHKTHTLHSRSLLLSMLRSLVLAPHNSLSFLPVVKVTSSECCTHSQSLLQVHQALCIVAAKVSQTQPNTSTTTHSHKHTSTHPTPSYMPPHIHTHTPPCTPLQEK